MEAAATAVVGLEEGILAVLVWSILPPYGKPGDMTDAVYVGCLAVSPQSSVRNKEPWIGRWWTRRHVVSLPAQSTDFESRVPESCLHTGVARLGGGH